MASVTQPRLFPHPGLCAAAVVASVAGAAVVAASVAAAVVDAAVVSLCVPFVSDPPVDAVAADVPEEPAAVSRRQSSPARRSRPEHIRPAFRLLLPPTWTQRLSSHPVKPSRFPYFCGSQPRVPCRSSRDLLSFRQ